MINEIISKIATKVLNAVHKRMFMRRPQPITFSPDLPPPYPHKLWDARLCTCLECSGRRLSISKDLAAQEAINTCKKRNVQYGLTDPTFPRVPGKRF